MIRRNEIHFAQHSQLARDMKKISAVTGRTADSNGSKKPPRWFLSRFLADDSTCLSAILRSIALYFFNFRLLQSESLRFPFKTFKLISLIILTSSLLVFELIALRSFGWAVLST